MSLVPRDALRPTAQELHSPLRLSRFIRDNVEPILAEWETFARSLPGGGAMDVAALRDHAKAMLLVFSERASGPGVESQSLQGVGSTLASGGTSSRPLDARNDPRQHER